MSFSYGGDIANSNIDFVRFKLGDTSEERAKLSDEEIQSCLTMYTNKEVATIECCKAILASVAPMVDYKIGPEEVDASGLYDHYNNLLSTLKKEFSRKSVPYCKVSKPQFTIGMHDNV